MRLFYTIGIWFYTLGVRVAALFGHSNARLMVQGWSSWREALARLDGRPVVWFHAASLGEFEQARPVLERYVELHPGHQVLLTFFSPSGYEVRKNYPKSQEVCYLPPDLPRIVQAFTAGVADLRAVFFVKYDFWFNYLGALRQRGVPTYLFSAIFRPDQYFFRWYGGWFRRQLATCYTHIFVQNEESLRLLKGNGVERCSLAGDTRFDRVHQIAQSSAGDEIVEQFLSGQQGKVLVCGSTWPPDEEQIAEVITTPLSPRRGVGGEARIILAPHIISEEHLRQIERLFPDSIRYSVAASRVTECLGDCVTEWSSNQDTHQPGNPATQSPSHPATPKVLIIDNIGRLSKLYRYADVAYIGGGFGAGIHNTLEAVAYGKPVLFGPNYHKFQEARDLIARGAGWSHTDAATLRSNLERLLASPEAYASASKACLDYMNENLGSTDKIIGEIKK